MRAPRVCHVLYSGLGGHGSVVFSCLECDRDREFIHSLLFLGVEPLLTQYERWCLKTGIEHLYVAKSPGSDLRTQTGVFQALQNWKPDTVLLHSGYAGLPGCWLYRTLHPRSRLVYVEHTPNHQKSKREWLGSALAAWIADRVVYLTAESRDEVQARIGVFFRPKRTCLIPNGINADYFRPSPSQSTAQVLRVGMQARMTGGKDHATLIRALHHLRLSPWFPRLRLQLAGSGQMEFELRQLVSQLGLENKVEFLGLLDESALRDFLWNLEVYVHSTKGETLSTSILQAQACGLPVIASEVHGVRSSIEPGIDGILVEPGNPAALAEALELLLGTPELRQRLSMAAVERIRRDFTKERMWSSYAALCR